ncbi:MAG: CoA transferase [Betaproteobacteria bacterium]|nr:CoA transferase [Betaproteobacteria bacterium]
MNTDSSSAAPRGPLAGIRILDLTTVLLGPYATKFLGDLGADVIKIETITGEPRRHYGPARNPGMGCQFINLNRSKRAIAIDLKQAAGRDAFLRLVATADAVVHNSRAQAMARLRLDYESLRAVKPDIVYCGAVGFGRGGRYAARPAYDDVIQGLTALPSLLGRICGRPQFVPINLADRVCGVYLANAVLAALLHRVRSGEGQEVEVPMFETMAEFVLSEHIWEHSFEPPVDFKGEIRLFDRRPYATQDGYISLMASTDRQFRAFCDLIGRPQLKSDPRFENRTQRSRHLKEVYAITEEVLRTRTSAEWLALLDEADIPAAPLHTLESLLHDPHLDDVGLFEIRDHPTEGALRTMRLPLRFFGSRPHNARPSPHLGEHTEEVLREAGLSSQEIAALRDAGVITVPATTAAGAGEERGARR